MNNNEAKSEENIIAENVFITNARRMMFEFNPDKFKNDFKVLHQVILKSMEEYHTSKTSSVRDIEKLRDEWFNNEIGSKTMKETVWNFFLPHLQSKGEGVVTDARLAELAKIKFKELEPELLKHRPFYVGNFTIGFIEGYKNSLSLPQSDTTKEAELKQQLFIEESQNEMLIKECEDLKSAVVVSEHKVKELTEAVNWALNNCKPERDELHSDFFNILTNALNVPE